MQQAFYKTNPTQDTPYRQLSLEYASDDWRVRLTGATMWGREHAEELRVEVAQSFEAAKTLYDKRFIQLTAGGLITHTSLGNVIAFRKRDSFRLRRDLP